MEIDQAYMIGSEGGVDYLVISQHDGLSVGIKPIVAQENGMQLFVGFRVRCHENVEHPTIDVAAFMEENPGLFTWQKHSTARVSSMFGALFPLPFGQTKEAILKTLQESGFIQELVDQLSGMFTITAEAEKITAFIMPKFEVQVDSVATHFGTQEMPEGFEGNYAKFTGVTKVDDTPNADGNDKGPGDPGKG